MILGSIQTPLGRLYLEVVTPPSAPLAQPRDDTAEIEARIARAEAKLTDPNFLSRAPSRVVVGVWEQLRADYARFL